MADSDDQRRQKVAEMARELHAADANCAEAVWQACAIGLGLDPQQQDFGNRLAGGFGGGLGTGDLCGAAAGAIMVLGYVYGRNPDEPRSREFRERCRLFSDCFQKRFDSLDCRDLRQPDNRAWCGEIVAITAAMVWEQLYPGRADGK